MTKEKKEQLEQTALNVRAHILDMSTNGGCFIGASLSWTDLCVYLYKEFLNITKETLKDPSRDYLFLSKGHTVPALYATFAELGWIEKERLKNHLKTNDFIYWHPNVNIPGIEFHSGSLGHNLSVASGVAIDCRLKGGKNKVTVVVGDGELNEGSNWEAILVASAYKLDNLLVIVDRNKFQANIETEDLIPLTPLDEKFKSFGCAVKNINGHNFGEIEAALSSFPFEKGKVSVLIADTTRGKGIPSIQSRADRWFANFSADEIELLKKELYAEHQK